MEISFVEPIPERVMFGWLDRLLEAARRAVSLKGDKMALLAQLEQDRAFADFAIIPVKMAAGALAQGVKATEHMTD